VALELFYILEPQDSRNSLEAMKKKHLYLKAADAYSVGVLAKQIWKEEWNRDLLPDAMQFTAFDLKLKSLTDRDLETRSSILDIF
jgi:hypothetical protein